MMARTSGVRVNPGLRGPNIGASPVSLVRVHLLLGTGGFGNVELAAGFAEAAGLFVHAGGEGVGFDQVVLGGVVADLLGDLHGTELRAAHAAEVGDLGALGGEGLVVERAGGLRVEGEVELVLPA